MTKRSLLAAGIVVALGCIGYFATRHESASAAAIRMASSTPAERQAAVERVVNERNTGVGDEGRRFEADGWQLVSATPPDGRLTSFDPGLLREGREGELRVQLASTVAAPRHARAIALIAMTARAPATREAATEALGHIGSDNAREALIDLITSGKLDPDDLGRRQIAAFLRPGDLDDECAAKIASLLDHPALTAAEKQQVAFNLALVGLRDGMTLGEPVLASLSPAARALLDRMTAVGSRSFLAHSHDHHD